MSRPKKPPQLWVVNVGGLDVFVRHRREDSARVIAVAAHVQVREADHADLKRLSETGAPVLGMEPLVDPNQTDWVPA